MPITSHQIGSMIGGQQAMFGNFASYSQQISPGFQGQPPTYANPMAGAGDGFSPPPSHMQSKANMELAPQMMSAAGNIGLPALGTAAMLGGSMLPGAAGRIMGSLDPFSAGLGGFARGAGLRSGAGGIMANMGRVASGGLGSIARAGLGGIGGAMGAAALPLAGAAVASFGVGQMVQGAQFQNQVQGSLDRNFRFQNKQSESGYGFSRAQGGNIADMVREMGHSDMMSGPQEMLRIMKSGTQQGLFRAVQDVKEFKKRFTEMVGALKEVSQTMNTTLEGAMPFFNQARQMGFWTPNDIAKNAQQVRQTAAASGMSVAQTQQMMGQGAQMARSIGASGATGAEGMQRSLEMVGGGLRGGHISEQALSEATGGLTGAAAVQSMAGTMQAGATRFARSSKARWLMASMGRNGFSSLDPGKMQDMMSGNMSLGEISSGARRNINQQGAFNFVNNEEQLRGQILKQGPGAQYGFMRAMTGEHLYGGDARSKLITRRLIKRNFGGNDAQADLSAKLARNASQIMRENLARGESGTDQSERDRELLLNRSWEGLKRKASNWVDKTVKEPIQDFGADISRSIGDYFERVSNKMWGLAAAPDRFRGITGSGIDALKRGALGDTRAMEQTFGKPGSLQKKFGSLGGGGDLGVGATMDFSKGGGIARAWEGERGGFMNALKLTMGAGGEVTSDKMDVMLRMGAKERKFGSAEERDEAVRKGGLYSGRMEGEVTGSRMYGGSSGKAASYNAFEKTDVDRIRKGMSVGVTGKAYDKSEAEALGFESAEKANAAIEAASKEVMETSYRDVSMGTKKLEGLTGIELGRAKVELIEAKKMGGSALRNLLSKGKDMASKISLLAAASTGERDMRGGLDLSAAAKSAGIGTFTGIEDLESQLAEKAEKGAEGLGASLVPSVAEDLASRSAGEMGGLYGGNWLSNVFGGEKVKNKPHVGNPETMQKISKEDDFRKAMRLMNTTGSDDEVAAAKKEARGLLIAMASDKDRFNDTDSETLRALAKADHPSAKVMEERMKALGAVYQGQESARFTQQTMRRGARIFRRMGEEKGKVMGALDKVKDERGNSLGQLMRELQSNTDDPTKYQETMGKIVKLGENASEVEVAQSVEVLTDYGGVGIANLLKGGRGIEKTMKRLTAKGGKKAMGRAAGAATDIVGDLLGASEISGEDMAGIRSGDAATIKGIVDKAPKENQGRLEEILTSMGSGAEKGKSIEDLLRGQTVSQTVDLLGDGTDAREKQTIGRLGSPAGIHQTIAEGNVLLEELIRVTRKSQGRPGTENFAEKP